MGFLLGLQFLTILPVPVIKNFKPETYGSSLPYFPVIGLILGAILYGVAYGLSYILPASIVSAFVIVLLVLLTGAHHLDGLMDTFDGLVGNKTRERRLEIMADSHVGSFGVISVVLLLLLKYISISNITFLTPALIIMPAISRYTVVFTIYIFPSAKNTGMGTIFKKGANCQRLLVATAVTVLVSVLLLGWVGIALMAMLLLTCWGIASIFCSRFGGLTGDNYGAVNELAEVISLLLLIIIWSNF